MDQEFYRHVKKGEKGIPIFAYTPYTCVEKERAFDSAGKEVVKEIEREVAAYKVVHVYDINQTDGEPLPVIAKELEYNVNNYDVLFQALTAVTSYRVTFEDLERVKGYCDPDRHLIVINKGMSESQTIKTLAHEVVHSTEHAVPTALYRDTGSKADQEVEAELAAYVVCEHYGIDTSDYSFPYITVWGRQASPEDLLNICSRVQHYANNIIQKTDVEIRRIHELSQLPTIEPTIEPQQ